MWVATPPPKGLRWHTLPRERKGVQREMRIGQAEGEGGHEGVRGRCGPPAADRNATRRRVIPPPPPVTGVLWIHSAGAGHQLTSLGRGHQPNNTAPPPNLHVRCGGEHTPNVTVLGMTLCEAAGAGVGGAPRGRGSACERRDDCPPPPPSRVPGARDIPMQTTQCVPPEVLPRTPLVAPPLSAAPAERGLRDGPSPQRCAPPPPQFCADGRGRPPAAAGSRAAPAGPTVPRAKGAGAAGPPGAAPSAPEEPLPEMHEKRGDLRGGP